MKEIETKDLPQIGGGIWNDDGCLPWRDPLPEPRFPVAPTPDPIGPEL